MFWKWIRMRILALWRWWGSSGNYFFDLLVNNTNKGGERNRGDFKLKLETSMVWTHKLRFAKLARALGITFLTCWWIIPTRAGETHKLRFAKLARAWGRLLTKLETSMVWTHKLRFAKPARALDTCWWITPTRAGETHKLRFARLARASKKTQNSSFKTNNYKLITSNSKLTNIPRALALIAAGILFWQYSVGWRGTRC
jgi:hypothetical protein